MIDYRLSLCLGTPGQGSLGLGTLALSSSLSPLDLSLQAFRPPLAGICHMSFDSKLVLTSTTLYLERNLAS